MGRAAIGRAQLLGHDWPSAWKRFARGAPTFCASGEMGIGNTNPIAAGAILFMSLYGGAASDGSGPGTASEGEVLQRKDRGGGRPAIALTTKRIWTIRWSCSGGWAGRELAGQWGGRDLAARDGADSGPDRGYVATAAAASLLHRRPIRRRSIIA